MAPGDLRRAATTLPVLPSEPALVAGCGVYVKADDDERQECNRRKVRNSRADMKRARRDGGSEVVDAALRRACEVLGMPRERSYSGAVISARRRMRSHTVQRKDEPANKARMLSARE